MTLFCGLTISSQTQTKGSIQRVRIDFKTPQGFVRHLLFAFTSDNRASDGIDYGFDGRNIENLQDDLNWMIADDRFVIQGVGAYDTAKIYPFGMFLTNTGPIEISLTKLENFTEPIPVYIYDSVENTYTHLNAVSYKKTLDNGIYHNRFFLSFNNIEQTVLSNKDLGLEAVSVNYLRSTKTLYIDSKGLPLKLKLYTLQGQLLSTHALNTNATSYDIPLSYLQNQVLLTVLEADQKTLYKRILIN